MIDFKELDNNTKALIYFALILIVATILGTVINNIIRNNSFKIKGVEYTITSDYNFDNAEKDGYVVYKRNYSANEDKVEQFYNDVQNNRDSSITLINYTRDNFPLIDQFHYKDGKLILYLDYTRDPFADETYKDEVISFEINDIEIDTNAYGKKFIKEKNEN